MRHEWFSRQPDAFSRRPDVFSRQPDVSSRQPDAFSRQPDAFGRQPDAFSRQPDASSRQPDAFGCRCSCRAAAFSVELELFVSSRRIFVREIKPASLRVGDLARFKLVQAPIES